MLHFLKHTGGKIAFGGPVLQISKQIKYIINTKLFMPARWAGTRSTVIKVINTLGDFGGH